MKKSKRSLNLNRETVRALGHADLTRAGGGEFNTALCTVRDTLCCPPPPRGPGGSFATCFAGGCQTIVSQ